MLDEIVKQCLQVEDKWDIDFEIDEKLAKLSFQQKFELAKEYNQQDEKNIMASCVIASIDIGIRDDRVYDADSAKEMMAAYHKCAETLFSAQSKEKDEENKELLDMMCNRLQSSIHHLTIAHKETAKETFEIYNQYMIDRVSIGSIGTYMRKNPKTWEQGFKIIHKIFEIKKRKAQLQHEENPKLACSEQLRILFLDLYDVATSPEKIAKIVEEYSFFENNMDKSFLPRVEGEIDGVHCYIDGTEEFENYPALLKHILSSSMNKRRINQLAKVYGKDNREVETYTSIHGPLSNNFDTPFKVIYEEFKEKYKDELERLKAEYTQKQKRKDAFQSKEQENTTALNFDIDLIYAGETRPTIEGFKNIVPYSIWGTSKGGISSKPEDGGLWTSPLEENGKSEWQNFVAREKWANKEEMLRKCAQSWHIVPTDECRILVIDDYSQIEEYCKNDQTIDFKKLSKDYDLLYLPYECGSWDATFRSWDVKTGYFMNAKTKDGKPLFQILDDEEYKRYKIEKNRKKVALLKGKDPLTAKKAGNTQYNKALMQALKESKQK